MVNIELMDENEDGPTGVWYNYENEELDAAIDAALKEQADADR